MAKKDRFREIITDPEESGDSEQMEELDAKIRSHRMGIARRVLILLGVILLIFVIMQLYLELRSYSSFEVRESIPRTSSAGAAYAEFSGYIVSYSNDGIGCMDDSGEAVWNRSFEMSSPQICTCGNYLAIYDAGGTKIYILTTDGVEQEIEVAKPIQKVCIAKQGVVAALMKEDEVFYVRLYDRKGKDIASGEFYVSAGGYPIDIALSQDAGKLAVDMIDISGGSVSSTVSFYNFGSVGQNEIDNNVGSFTYEGVFIPEISYVSDNRMLAIADDRCLIFEGGEKPKETRQLVWEQEVESVFYNRKYIGTVYAKKDEGDTSHIRVYDMKGGTVMEHDTAVRYEEIGFLANNNICVSSGTQVEIFTIHSIRKFHYDFEEKLQYILSQDRYQNYLFVYEDRLDEVRLK